MSTISLHVKNERSSMATWSYAELGGYEIVKPILSCGADANMRNMFLRMHILA